MIKKDIVKIVSAKAGIKEAAADYVVEEVLAAMKNALSEGDNIHIRGFGSLEPVVRKGKVAYNFQTGGKVTVPEKNDVKFVKSKNFNL